MRKGSGIGFVAVLLAMAIVAILAARSWLAVAPAAKQIMDVQNVSRGVSKKMPAKRGAANAGVPDHGDAEAGAAIHSGELPDLSDMKSETDQHAKDVAKAMAESNR